MMDGREEGRRETDAGLQCLWWFHVHRGLCMGGALGRLAPTPEGSECTLAVCYSGAPSALDTASAQGRFRHCHRGVQTQTGCLQLLGLTAPSPLLVTRWPGSAWVEEPGLPSQLT